MKGAQENRYFMWREDPETEGHLTEKTATIDSVIKMLPKHFFKAHKKKIRQLTEHVMLDKISPQQFRFIYREITGDQSKAPTSEQEKYDERIRCIIKNADETMARDSRREKN